MLSKPWHPRLQAGMSLVELMIGMTVGIIIMSGALVFFGNYVKSNRDLLLGTMLNQELRAAADLIVRDLRRGGYWQNAINGVWYAGITQVQANPHAAIDAGGELIYSYAQDGDNAVSSGEQTGFRLAEGVLQMLRNGEWEDMTSRDTTEVTAFTITPTSRTVPISCVNACPGGGQACWPTLTVREVTLFIEARAKSDSSVQRQIAEAVRVRNDALSIPLLADAAPKVCPAS